MGAVEGALDQPPVDQSSCLVAGTSLSVNAAWLRRSIL